MPIKKEVLYRLHDHQNQTQIDRNRDVSLVPLPYDYVGPAVLRSKVAYIPVVVISGLNETDGRRKVSVMLDIPNEDIRLEGGVMADMFGAKPSDVANFLSGIVRPQVANADFVPDAKVDDFDESLMVVPAAYKGPAVLKTHTLGIPVYVDEYAGEQGGEHRFKLLLDVPESPIRLHGTFANRRIKAGASDIEKFRVGQKPRDL